VSHRGRPALGFAIVGFVSNPDDWRNSVNGFAELENCRFCSGVSTVKTICYDFWLKIKRFK
jgi:hypothetical protein